MSWMLPKSLKKPIYLVAPTIRSCDRYMPTLWVSPAMLVFLAMLRLMLWPA
jgi:hypothetical protein